MLMNTANMKKRSFSADVEMELRVNGQIFKIGQLGPDFLILTNPIDHPPAGGQITVSIDGDVTTWPVRLPDGVATDKVRTRITTG
jgi:hypothetical protein